MKLDDILATKIGKDPKNRAILEALHRKQGAPPNLGGLQDPQCKPHPIPALDPRAKIHPSRKGCVVVVAQIIRFAKTEIDKDNFVAGVKPLQDAIARTLGVDDRDRRIEWQYRQVIGTGTEGTLVKINTV